MERRTLQRGPEPHRSHRNLFGGAKSRPAGALRSRRPRSTCAAGPIRQALRQETIGSKTTRIPACSISKSSECETDPFAPASAQEFADFLFEFCTAFPCNEARVVA